MTDQVTRPPLAERVSEKIGMAKWMTELYFQTAAIVTTDKRYKTIHSKFCSNYNIYCY